MTPLTYVNTTTHYLLTRGRISPYTMTEHYQTYREVQAAGPPATSLDFPTPVIHRASIIPIQTVLDHHRQRYESKARLYKDVNLLCRSSGVNDPTTDNVYWMKKQISKTTYGTVQFCIVVRRRCNNSLNRLHDDVAEWITTDETVAIKVSSMKKMRKNGESMSVTGPLLGTLVQMNLVCVVKR
jgi:hypothetical protein